MECGEGIEVSRRTVFFCTVAHRRDFEINVAGG